MRFEYKYEYDPSCGRPFEEGECPYENSYGFSDDDTHPLNHLHGMRGFRLTLTEFNDIQGSLDSFTRETTYPCGSGTAGRRVHSTTRVYEGCSHTRQGKRVFETFPPLLAITLTASADDGPGALMGTRYSSMSSIPHIIDVSGRKYSLVSAFLGTGNHFCSVTILMGKYLFYDGLKGDNWSYGGHNETTNVGRYGFIKWVSPHRRFTTFAPRNDVTLLLFKEVEDAIEEGALVEGPLENAPVLRKFLYFGLIKC